MNLSRLHRPRSHWPGLHGCPDGAGEDGGKDDATVEQGLDQGQVALGLLLEAKGMVSPGQRLLKVAQRDGDRSERRYTERLAKPGIDPSVRIRR